MKPRRLHRGDLVRWFVNYRDVETVKETGIGIVANYPTLVKIADSAQQKEYNIEYYTFKVYRIEEKDYVFFEEHNLEKL